MLSVEVFVPPKSTVLVDTASAAYMAVDPATAADKTAVAASAVGFPH